MAIYRPPKARWPLATAVGFICLLVGLGVGLLLGGDETDPATAAAEVRTALIEASGSLEVAEVEYRESVEDGAITRQAEYDGALAALDSARDRYGEVAPAIEALAPERANDIESRFDTCEQLMNDLADPDEVSECLTDLGAALSE